MTYSKILEIKYFIFKYIIFDSGRYSNYLQTFASRVLGFSQHYFSVSTNWSTDLELTFFVIGISNSNFLRRLLISLMLSYQRQYMRSQPLIWNDKEAANKEKDGNQWWPQHPHKALSWLVPWETFFVFKHLDHWKMQSLEFIYEFDSH